MNAKDEFGFTPLMHAKLYNSNLEVLSVLIEKTIKDIFTIVGFGTAKEVQQTIEEGADLHVKTEMGISVFMWASMVSSNVEVITALINAGADVNERHETGITPLMAASM